MTCRVVDLKELCRERGEPVSGTKAALISRLLALSFKDSPPSKEDASEAQDPGADSQQVQGSVQALDSNDQADQSEKNRGEQKEHSMEMNSTGEHTHTHTHTSILIALYTWIHANVHMHVSTCYASGPFCTRQHRRICIYTEEYASC
jgi:hypothetical protein